MTVLVLAMHLYMVDVDVDTYNFEKKYDKKKKEEILLYKSLWYQLLETLQYMLSVSNFERR